MRQQGALAHRLPVMRILSRPPGARCRGSLSLVAENFHGSAVARFILRESSAATVYLEPGFPIASQIS
jgi:hypothetical protein